MYEKIAKALKVTIVVCLALCLESMVVSFGIIVSEETEEVFVFSVSLIFLWLSIMCGILLGTLDIIRDILKQ